MNTSYRNLVAPAVFVFAGGCNGAPQNPPPVDDLATLTNGVQVKPMGCPYSVTTPAETTTPVPDDGKATAAPTALHVSWTGDPSTSVSLVWTGPVGTRGTRVDYGSDASYGKTQTGFSFAYPTDSAGNDPPSVRAHEVHLCGLTPGTTYHYRAGAGTFLSADATFTTAPAATEPTGKPLRFAIAGDSRGNSAQWGEVLKDAAGAGAQFIVYSGDAVDLGTIQTAWDAWFAAGATVLPSLPMMFAWGNHEITARHALAQLALPNNELWYSFDYGDVHFTVLDDTPPPQLSSSVMNEQAAFLEADLTRTTRTWKVVIHHRAIFSSSSHGSQMDLQQAWMPIYDKHGVDAVFNGHDHNYERTKPMKGGQPITSGKGTVYVVNGGGGADLYASGNSAFTAFSKSTFAYSIVDVVGSTMTITAYQVQNGTATQMDQVKLSK